MSSGNNNNRLADHPVVILIGVIASLIGIFVFVTGKQSIPDILNNATSSPTISIEGSIRDRQSPITIPIAINKQGRIAFSSNRDGNSDIYVMDADGSNQHRL